MPNLTRCDDAVEYRVVDITPRRAARTLMQIYAFLLAGHTLALIMLHGFGHPMAKGLVPSFHMDFEGNVPTFVATQVLFACAAMAALMPTLRRISGWDRLGWFFLAAVFAFLSMDEIVGLHEHAGRLAEILIPPEDLPYYDWTVPYALLVMVIAGALLPWFVRLERRSQVLFVLSGCLFIGGALGMETISGFYYGSLDPDRLVYRTLTGDLLATVEECMEFCGTGLFLCALIRHAGGIRLVLPSH
jgi:hypothetical protein